MNDLFVDELSAVVGFSGNPLDRLSEKRDDAQTLAELVGRPDARSLVFVSDTPVLRQTADGFDAFSPSSKWRRWALATIRPCSAKPPMRPSSPPC